jgi:predicted amidohydrolase YtcJ
MADNCLLLGDDIFGWEPGRLVAVESRAGLITGLHFPAVADLPPLLARFAPDAVQDCRGRLVLPGLIDAHVHAIATGMALLSPQLNSCATLEQVAAAIEQEASGGREFIRLTGLDLSRLVAEDSTQLDRSWLDAQLPGHALFLKSVEGHSGWFNTLAWQRLAVDGVLAACGVAAEEQQAMYRSGRVFGAAYEELTTPLYDSYSREERREAMALVQRQALAAGLVGLHCLEGYGRHRRDDFQMILDLDGDELDLVLYCRDSTPQLALELGVPRFGGCWCVDGAIGAHTAAISGEYVSKPGCCGELYFSTDQLAQWLGQGLMRGLQPCLHAIGGRALDQALAALNSHAAACDLPALRPRVDHFVCGTPQLAQRAAALGAVSAMQPAFDARWGGVEGGYALRLGPQRALDTNPVGTMQQAGLHVAGSSDSYITPLDPLGGIRAAMQHHNPQHRVSFEAAVRLFSADAAYVAHQEQRRGSIAPGYQADFTVVAGDRSLDGAQVALVVRGGRCVHRAGASTVN